MEIDQSCFAKLIDVVNGNDMFIRSIPCIFGRYSHIDNLNIKEKKNFMGKTVDLNYNGYKDFNLDDYRVRSKLIIERCKRM
jgi:hypothetical protein